MTYSNVEFSLENSFDDALLNCNSTQIFQVFVNILNNALYEVKAHKKPFIKIEILKEGKDIVRINFIDSGKGTGIALSISYKIIQEHGGEMWVDQRNDNTCFAIKLPIKAIVPA